jgi:hypothetical protein
MWTAAQNDQIRATELKIINQPTAAPIVGTARIIARRSGYPL